MEPVRNSSDAAAIAAIGEALARAEQKIQRAPVRNGKPFVILNDQVTYIDGACDKPSRVWGTVKLDDTRSFCEYVKQFGVGTTTTEGVVRVFGSLDPLNFMAVLNDHASGTPTFGDHRALFQPAYSKEWIEWGAHDGKAFDGNEAFGEFIEDNAFDIIEPGGVQMLDIALNMRIATQVSFGKAVRLSDGNIKLEYSEIVDASSAAVEGGETQKIAIPEKFKIRIPVFVGIDSPLFEIEARFRFRLERGRLKIWYDLVRKHKVVEDAFKKMWDQIGTDLGTSVLLGAPRESQSTPNTER